MDFILQPILLFIELYIWLIIISAILSLLQVDPRQPVVEIVNRLTQPAFSFVRQKMPFVVVSGIDLSPLVIILGLNFFDTFMMHSLT